MRQKSGLPRIDGSGNRHNRFEEHSSHEYDRHHETESSSRAERHFSAAAGTATTDGDGDGDALGSGLTSIRWIMQGECRSCQWCGPGLELSRLALSPNPPQFWQNQSEIRAALEASDRAAVESEIRAALAGESDGALAQQIADNLPARVEELVLLESEWQTRLKRLKLRNDDPKAVAEAEAALASINRELEDAEAQLARSKDDLMAMLNRRNKLANDAAARVITEAITHLKSERLRLFNTIVAKIGLELDALAATEIKPMCLPNREQNAVGLVPEILKSLEGASIRRLPRRRGKTDGLAHRGQS